MASVTITDAYTNTSALTTYTSGSLNLGTANTDKSIFVLLAGRGFGAGVFTGVTVDDNDADLVDKIDGDVSCAIYRIDAADMTNPSLTAGVVVATCSSAPVRGFAMVVAVSYDDLYQTAYAIAKAVDSTADEAQQTVDVSANTLSNACVIGIGACYAEAGGTTWAGLNNDTEYQVSPTAAETRVRAGTASGVSAETPRTISFISSSNPIGDVAGTTAIVAVFVHSADVSHPWTPDDYEGGDMQYWFDANDGVLNNLYGDQGRVDSWPNKGIAGGAVTATGSDRPYFDLETSSFANNSTVIADANGQRLSMTAAFGSGTGIEFCMFDSSLNGMGITSDPCTTLPQAHISVIRTDTNPTDTEDIFRYNGVEAGVSLDESGGTLTTAAQTFIVAGHTVDEGQNGLGRFLDQKSTTFALFNRSTDNARTGTGHRIAEVLGFSSKLSDADIEKFEGYLAWKYDLVDSLPSDHPYKLQEPWVGTPPEADPEPPATADMLGWYRGDSLVANTSNGQFALSWSDKTANAYDLSLLGRPQIANNAYGTRVAARTGHGPSDTAYAFSRASTPAKTHPLTIVAVAKCNQSSADGGIDSVFDSQGSSSCTLYFNPGDGKYYLYNGTNLGQSGTTNDQEWHLLQSDFNGSSSKIYVDGVEVASGNPGSEALNGLRIGQWRWDGTNGGVFNGDIAEVIVYNKVLSSDERAELLQYYQDYYGATFPPEPDVTLNKTDYDSSSGSASTFNFTATIGTNQGFDNIFLGIYGRHNAVTARTLNNVVVDGVTFTPEVLYGDTTGAVWQPSLAAFVKVPRNSLPTPGNTTISVAVNYSGTMARGCAMTTWVSHGNIANAYISTTGIANANNEGVTALNVNFDTATANGGFLLAIGGGVQSDGSEDWSGANEQDNHQPFSSFSMYTSAHAYPTLLEAPRTVRLNIAAPTTVGNYSGAVIAYGPLGPQSAARSNVQIIFFM